MLRTPRITQVDRICPITWDPLVKAMHIQEPLTTYPHLVDVAR